MRKGKAIWSMKAIEDIEGPRIAAMFRTGMSVRDIADEIGMAKSTVHRMLKRMHEAALRRTQEAAAFLDVDFETGAFAWSIIAGIPLAVRGIEHVLAAASAALVAALAA